MHRRLRSASERHSRKIWRRRTGSARRNAVGCARRLTLVGLMLLATAHATLPAYAQPSSDRPDVVELSVAEADSILATIDGLRIDLWETRELAAQDSLYYEQRLALTEKAYEQMLDAYKDERPNWLERLAKQPVVWLAVGMWIGVQAR